MKKSEDERRCQIPDTVVVGKALKVYEKKSSSSSSTINMEEGITFGWSNINVSTKPVLEKKYCGLRLKKGMPEKQLLSNISGVAKPGEVLAIMGASGAGKSTFLNTLLFRNTEGLQTSGTRIANGSIVTPTSLTSVSAYVQQDDLFIPSLTVREHLLFQSRVRMDGDVSSEERLERIEKVMKLVGLKKAEKVLIGDEKLKGISGGEKRRLSFASEFLTNPSILFCDEPTSGLDSFMAVSIMDLMTSLARMGKTIICTIHQPSSQIFNKFDKLLLLAEGQTAYHGKASDAISFFSSINYPCPENYNPADHFIQTLAVIPGDEEESRKKIKTVSGKFSESEISQEMKAEVKAIENDVQDEDKSRHKDDIYKASWFKQLSALIWRQTIATLRNPMTSTVKIVTAVIVGLILGTVYWRQDMDQDGIKNIMGVLFVIVTNASFSSVFAICNSFCSEIPIFLREHFNGMYRTDTYFLAKLLVEAPIIIAEFFIGFSIVYWMAYINPDVMKYLIALGIILLIVQVTSGLGYFLSCASPNVDFALGICPLLIIPAMLFGGFYLKTDSVVPWLAWIQYISWFYYGYSALVINQWSGVTDIACPLDQTVPTPGANTSVSQLCITTGEDVLKDRDIDPDSFTLDIILLVVLAVVFRLFAFLSLYLRARRKS